MSHNNTLKMSEIFTKWNLLKVCHQSTYSIKVCAIGSHSYIFYYSIIRLKLLVHKWLSQSFALNQDKSLKIYLWVKWHVKK